MAWLQLLIAGVLETGWAVGLKYTEGWTRPGPSVAVVVTMIASMWLLGRAAGQAANQIPIGTAYPVWTGIGAVGTAILGMVFFGESRDAMRLVCIGLIVLGVLGLHAGGK